MMRIWIKTLIGGSVLLAAFTFVPHAVAQPCLQPPAGLVSWWPGDGTADDLVGGNNGTLMGGVTFAPGRVGQAFLLNGMDGSVNPGNAENLRVSGSDFTVDAWVNFNSLLDSAFSAFTFCIPGLGCDMSIVDKMSSIGVNADGWRLLKQADNRFWFCLGGGSGNGCSPGAPTTVISGTVAETGRWYHVAVVKTSSAISIYVNGALEATTPLGGFTDTHSADLLIGSFIQSGAFLNGLVDEVQIYNRALTDAEIQAIFNAGAAGKCKLVPFATFAAKMKIRLHSPAGDDKFEVNATFMLGDGSNGIDPLTEAVSLHVGTFFITIPAGSFKQDKKGRFKVEGVVDGAVVEVVISPLGSRSFELKAEGKYVNLIGPGDQVLVKFTIGDDHGP